MVNESTIVRFLLTRNDAVERAMVVLYDRQTQDEKASESTRHDNQRGFSAADASKGTYYARWVLGGRHLTGHHLDRARKMALKYRRQLVDAANQRAQKAARVGTSMQGRRFVETSDGTYMRA